MIRTVVGVITAIFSKATTPFLKSENRYFVVLVRDVVENFLYIAMLVICCVNTKIVKLSLTNAGIAYIVSNGVAAIWMFILILKIPFLDVEYVGVAKF